MLYNIAVFVSFFQSVIGFTLMTSSTMRFREPIKKRIIIGLFVMFCGISLLSYQLFAQGMHSVDSFAILVILAIQLSWFLICSADSFFVSLFSFLTFVNIYVSISYVSDTLAMDLEGTAFVIGRMAIRLLIYIIILPLLFKLVRPRFRRLVDTLDQEWHSSMLVPLLFLIMQIVVLYYPGPYWHWTHDNWYRVVIVTVYMLFLAVYYLLYIQANSIVEKYALEKRQLLMNHQEKMYQKMLESEQDLRFAATHDSLTGLYNRTYINEILDSKPPTLPFAVFMIDIDRLKYVNDNHGHAEGDKLIIGVAEILKKCFRKTDVLARIGGDEFVAILYETNAEEAQIIKNRIKEQITIHNLSRQENNVEFSFSIGFAVGEAPKDNIERMMKKADEWMYVDKSSKPE
jgi:diguanylate cyclase (GGDEF)-like protein